MKYTTSININYQDIEDFKYIPTPNAKNVVGTIINAFHSGVHSFNIIGSYGTGKSSFIVGLEKNLTKNEPLLIQNTGQFNGFKEFKFLKIIGDYVSLNTLIKERIYEQTGKDYNNVFDAIDNYYQALKAENKFLFLFIDEFGKILEYAAKNNAEKELYFIQKLTEYINEPKRNIILITTLHQNFSAYAKRLTEEQRNEWQKVKGRFAEIVFNEPVEQLIYLAASRINSKPSDDNSAKFKQLYNAAVDSKFISNSISEDIAYKLYPMDIFSASAITQAIQKYGQNERSLFSFLETKGENSIFEFKHDSKVTFNLSNVYDYIIYNFYSYLSEANSDSMIWSGMRVAIERVEGILDEEFVADAIKLVKTIGLLNLFGSAKVTITKEAFKQYALEAIGIKNIDVLLSLLTSHKIIKYPRYKSQYILFDGTDINIEDELIKASGIVRKDTNVIDKLRTHFTFPVIPAIASYYKTGTPRYFEYIITEEPISLIPEGENDGYIQLVFDSKNTGVENTVLVSESDKEAILYVYFNNVDMIVNHLWELDKLNYILDKVLIDTSDTVASKEINKLIEFEISLLNKAVLDNMFSTNEYVQWIYKGQFIEIHTRTQFNKYLSQICEDVYSSIPFFNNELINKHKPSSAISLARVNYFQKLLESFDKEDLGFEKDKFPPEKTIYMTLLKNTGMHRNIEGVHYGLESPIEESFAKLWDACNSFLESTTDKPRKLAELIKELKVHPFKLKQGFLDIWIPTFLLIKRDDYVLYNGVGAFIPAINREVLDILQKSPNDFSIKAFSVDGVKVDLFNKYRQAINLDDEDFITTDKFIETIKPFLTFYRKLNPYAKSTKKFDNPTTLKFRNVLANAKDPEKTFFEDLPKALGYKDKELVNNNEFLAKYIETIQSAIRDLRTCYDALLDRIENVFIDRLRLKSHNFEEYKVELELRYKNVKTHLLTTKQRNFLSRVLSPLKDRQSWIQSISYIVFDKQLETIHDDEEEALIDNLVFLFNELVKYVEISKIVKSEQDKFFRLELISSSGELKPEVFRVPESKERDVESLENKISQLMTGNNDVDICSLLSVLKKKLEK
jgi:hypothetical protein